MKDPKDPVQQLTDTLTLLRVEIADVKSRQITEKQLKHLHLALEKTALKVKQVADYAHAGAQKGAERLIQQINEVSYDIKTNNSKAILSLTDAHRAIQGSYPYPKAHHRPPAAILNPPRVGSGWNGGR